MKLPAATAPASTTADGSGTAALPNVCSVMAALMAVLPIEGYGGRFRVSAIVSAATQPPLSAPKNGLLPGSIGCHSDIAFECGGETCAQGVFTGVSDHGSGEIAKAWFTDADDLSFSAGGVELEVAPCGVCRKAARES